jgi:hypothetical protein
MAVVKIALQDHVRAHHRCTQPIVRTQVARRRIGVRCGGVGRLSPWHVIVRVYVRVRETSAGGKNVRVDRDFCANWRRGDLVHELLSCLCCATSSLRLE